MRKKIMIFGILVVAIILGGSLVAYFYSTDNDGTPVGLQIQESIDLSYSEWITGTNYQWTGVIEGVDGEIRVRDSNVGLMAKATRSFTAIDIGKIKMDIRALSTSRNYFAMEFRSGNTILFKLERKSVKLTFVILSNTPIILFDMDTTFRTVEIFFDLSDSSNGKVSVSVDGLIAIDEFAFDPNDMDITNIYIHTLTSIYKSQTGIKFDYLYNYI